MTSPILVMNFYSLLNFKYVNLILTWSPKSMYCQTIDLDTLLQGSPRPCDSDLSTSKHRARQKERWPSPARPRPVPLAFTRILPFCHAVPSLK